MYSDIYVDIFVKTYAELFPLRPNLSRLILDGRLPQSPYTLQTILAGVNLQKFHRTRTDLIMSTSSSIIPFGSIKELVRLLQFWPEIKEVVVDEMMVSYVPCQTAGLNFTRHTCLPLEKLDIVCAGEVTQKGFDALLNLSLPHLKSFSACVDGRETSYQVALSYNLPLPIKLGTLLALA